MNTDNTTPEENKDNYLPEKDVTNDNIHPVSKDEQPVSSAPEIPFLPSFSETTPPPAPVKAVPPPAPAAGVPQMQQTTYTKPVKPVKTYWGMTAILTSWVGFLITQIIMAVILVIYTLYADPEIITQLSTDPDPNALIASVPWFLVVGQLSMYLLWWGSAWWVTAYRSGVQLGKRFIDAWKDNFYFRFKPVDILLGVGVAVVMFGLNFGITLGLPALFPELDLSDAGNTEIFKSLEGTAWYFIIAFGFGAFLGPITEELFFRGFMMKGLINHFGYAKVTRNIDDVEEEVAKKMGWEASAAMTSFRAWTNRWKNVLALIITSIVFGLMHFQGAETFGQWLVVIVTGLFGFVLGIITLKTKRISAAMIGHVCYNTSIFILVTLGLGS